MATQERRSVHLLFDVPLLLVVLTLLVFGLLMLYSASSDFAIAIMGQPGTFFLFKQMTWVALGLVVAAVLTFFDYHRYRRLMVPMMALTLLALIGVLIVNMGNPRGRTMLGGSVQPSELAKIAVIIYLAFWLYSKRDRLNQVSFGLIPLGTILGITCGFILMEPDISAGITLVLLGGIMFFLAGGEWRQIAVVVIVALVFGTLVVALSDTGRTRVTDWITGLRNPAQSSDQVVRSLQAIVSGKWIGVGIGNGEVKFTGLPLPHTDSIFAVIAEETGILGSLFLVSMYLVLVWRGLVIARRAPDQLGALLAGGLSIWIVMEALLNLTVIAGLLPVAGNALPFISYGGSNMAVMMVSIGILMNVARQGVQSNTDEGSIFNAVVDLRRGDRRGRVSRPGRPSGSRK
jgi:cell division protein FtsW